MPDWQRSTFPAISYQDLREAANLRQAANAESRIVGTSKTSQSGPAKHLGTTGGTAKMLDPWDDPRGTSRDR